MSEITVVHNPTKSRYEAHLDDTVVGVLRYRTAGTSLDLVHTEVPDEYEGRGFAGDLVRGTLDQLREDHLRVVVTCPYVRRWVQQHEDYQDLVELS